MLRCLVLGSPRTELRQAALCGCSLHATVQPASLAGWSPKDTAGGFDGVVVVGDGSRADAAAAYYRTPGRLVLRVSEPAIPAEGQYRVAPDPAWLPVFTRPGPADRLKALQVAAGEPHERKRLQRILVCGENPKDQRHGMSGDACREWSIRALGKCKSLDESEVVWRPDQLDRHNVQGADHYSDPRSESFEEALEGVWLVVVHSSDCGLKALLSGRPVIADYVDEGVRPIYAELSGSFSGFKDVRAPGRDELDDLLARIAYTQWTLTEIATGQPFVPFLVSEPEPAPPAPAEDFSKIKGIGEASAEKIAAAGFRTFGELCEADTERLEKIGLARPAYAALLGFVGREKDGTQAHG